MKTRSAMAADIDFLAEIFLCAMRPHIALARGSWDQPKEDKQFREQLQLDSTRIILDDCARVGFYMTRDDGHDLELHTICILPECQRQGRGTKVIRRILNDTQKSERGVALSVLKSNVGARSLYQRLGFVVIGETAPLPDAPSG
jgi:ribosomal protein S18 acetylase RimI-like enzyme